MFLSTESRGRLGRLSRRSLARQPQPLKRALEPLRQALEVHYRSLDELESALIEFEKALSGREERPERPQAKQGEAEAGGGGLELLSITGVCQELGMGKSWVYRRIQSGEIPSLKLGHALKVRQADLEEYVQRQRRNQAPGAPGEKNGSLAT